MQKELHTPTKVEDNILRQASPNVLPQVYNDRQVMVTGVVSYQAVALKNDLLCW